MPRPPLIFPIRLFACAILVALTGCSAASSFYAAPRLSTVFDFRPKNSGPDHWVPVMVRAICDSEP
jgi:hypothetical protein